MQECNPEVLACLPAICRGALIASGRKEAEAMVKCWVRGKPTGRSRDIHYPRHDQSSNEIAARTPSGPLKNIMQCAGYKDVVEEAQRELNGYGEGAMVVYTPGNRNNP